MEAKRTCDPSDGDATQLRIREPDEEGFVLALVQIFFGLLPGYEPDQSSEMKYVTANDVGSAVQGCVHTKFYF